MTTWRKSNILFDKFKMCCNVVHEYEKYSQVQEDEFIYLSRNFWQSDEEHKTKLLAEIPLIWLTD